MPAVCLSGSSNSTLIERQNWMAALEKTGGRPGRPSRGPSHAIPSSTRIGSEPRFPSDALQLDQFVVRSRKIDQPQVWNFSDAVITHPGIPI